MNTYKSLKKSFAEKAFISQYRELYGVADAEAQMKRSERVLDSLNSLFGTTDNIFFYSAPGRSEICGNHTDHNHGKVLAAAVNLDAVAAAAPVDGTIIRVKSEGHDMDIIDIGDLEPKKSEYSKSKALIRGICAGFVQRGYAIGGFDAATANDVVSGSGLSSSASFEVLIGTILNHLYNGGRISPVEIAQIAQYSENVFFGKPCGLLDQMTCSVGGFVEIDFNDTDAPVITPVDFAFEAAAHSLCIINTGVSHSDLNDDYAAVKNEMISVAECLGCSYLRQIDEERFFNSIDLIRKKTGDRALLRAMHFYSENKRVDAAVNALRERKFGEFKKVIISSGYSSFMYNQNVYVPGDTETSKVSLDQPLSLALGMCEKLLEGKGAWRVHGGGFAGTVQAFVPYALVDDFKEQIERVFGRGNCYILSIRPVGGVQIF